jgi:hypothetical protein
MALQRVSSRLSICTAFAPADFIAVIMQDWSLCGAVQRVDEGITGLASAAAVHAGGYGSCPGENPGPLRVDEARQRSRRARMA